jgi:hypothetical protein
MLPLPQFVGLAFLVTSMRATARLDLIPERPSGASRTKVRLAPGVSTYLSRRGLNQVIGSRLNREIFEQIGMLGGFFAQQGNEVEAGRAFSVAPPSGQDRVSGAAGGTEGLEGGEQQGAVGGDDQGRLFGDRARIPQLGLAHPQGVLFFAVIDFDVPAVEIDLQQLGGGTGPVGAQQIGRLAVVPACTLAFAIGGGRDDEQAQGAGAAPALPQQG